LQSIKTSHLIKIQLFANLSNISASILAVILFFIAKISFTHLKKSANFTEKPVISQPFYINLLFFTKTG